MNQSEIVERYLKLKEEMIESKDPKNMMLFGDVMDELIERLSKNDPGFAEREVDKLEAIMWKQYLSRSEAEEVVSKMQPQAPWGLTTWQNAMDNANLPREEEGIYNEYALWTAMNGKMSDHKASLSEFLPSDKLLQFVYTQAVESLTDEDGKFNVRKYYL
jgi:hypothetical protein